MFEPSVILPLDTPIEVKLTGDENGKVSLGIRINGGSDYLLCSDLALPDKGNSQSYSTPLSEAL